MPSALPITLLCCLYLAAYIIWRLYIDNDREIQLWEDQTGRMLQDAAEKNRMTRKRQTLAINIFIILTIATLVAGIFIFGQRVDSL